MKQEDIELMNKIKWMHEIELEPGVLTPSIWKHNIKERSTSIYGMPTDLTNKTVLDVGCWDGGFAFEAEKRGGDVTAIDIYQNQNIARQEAFNFAHRILNSKVKFEYKNVYELNGDDKYDIVFFYGVLYHIDNIFDAMEKLAKSTKEMLIIETALTHDKEILFNKIPICEWGFNSSNDHYNRWFPNLAFLEKISKDFVH